MVYFGVKIVITHPLVVANQVDKIIWLLRTFLIRLGIIVATIEVNHDNV